jgi:hypothetical protein
VRLWQDRACVTAESWMVVQLLGLVVLQLRGGVQGSASVLLGARSLPLVGTEIIPRRVLKVGELSY